METSVLKDMPTLSFRHSISAGSKFGLELFLIADEIVIDEKDTLSPTKCINIVQLSDDLDGWF